MLFRSQVCLTLSDTKTMNREIRALKLAASELNPLKITIITLDEKQELKEDDITIHVIPVVDWLLAQNGS